LPAPGVHQERLAIVTTASARRRSHVSRHEPHGKNRPCSELASIDRGVSHRSGPRTQVATRAVSRQSRLEAHEHGECAWMTSGLTGRNTAVFGVQRPHELDLTNWRACQLGARAEVRYPARIYLAGCQAAAQKYDCHSIPILRCKEKSVTADTIAADIGSECAGRAERA